MKRGMQKREISDRKRKEEERQRKIEVHGIKHIG
jgi:hypothetical protein